MQSGDSAIADTHATSLKDDVEFIATGDSATLINNKRQRCNVFRNLA
jgi:hypothetical protein